jgi:hypothetical protein
MSNAVNEVQFPMANGSVSSRLNLRNSMLRARSLQIVGGRVCNLKQFFRIIDFFVAIPQSYLFCAKFRILSSFRDPIANGRDCNSLLSITSSEQRSYSHIHCCVIQPYPYV